jgi:TolB-like protein/Flp pilus assembly protein TadD
VRQHLEEILASHVFASSKRTQDFLRLIVGHALDGEIDSLRERMIGAEMFGRPISYDTGSDSVVRVRANEARRRLAQYYGELHGQGSEVRIELRSGSYVPQFHFGPPGIQPIASVQAASPAPSPSPEAPQKDGVHATTATVKLPAEPQTQPPARLRPLRLWAGGAAVLILLSVAGYMGWKWRLGNANAPSGIHSIVILPLENLSGVASQDYFADGMTEELINDLGQISTLRVISLTSSMSYKQTKKKLPEIARELSVDGVVEGGVLRDGSQMRVAVQLIDARTDRPIWAHTYVRDLTSVLAWQEDVAHAIAEEISITVTPQEQARLTRKLPIDSEAQDLYLHGLLLRNADEYQNAAAYFRRAIDRNPGFAQAHSALASCYGRMGESGRMPYQQAFTLQKAEALKAIELDGSLSEAHAELANTAMTLDWDWPAAAAEFHRALELNPNSATSHEKYAFYLVRTGHSKEALAEISKAVDLDPVSGSTFHAEGFIYYFSRDYDQALAVTRTVQGLRINLPDWNFLLGDIYAEKHMYKESIAAFIKTGTDPYTLGHLGNVYARAGRAGAARDIISRLEENVKKDGVGRYEIALVYAGLGDKTNALQWLDQALEVHDVGLVYLKVDPCLDPLRTDPHFNELLRKIGLAPL